MWTVSQRRGRQLSRAAFVVQISPRWGLLTSHPRIADLCQSKDPFNRPSPGLVKRLAAEARSDAKRRHFQDAAGPSDEQRREILKAKAKKYDALRRGDFSGMTEKEVEESVIDVSFILNPNGSDHAVRAQMGRGRMVRSFL
jgi:hypothetical protein